MTANHADLIARLEKAEVGDREIDIEIDRLIRPHLYEGKVTPGVELPEGFGRDALSLAMHQAPHYTTSIDAALTLVPEGWHVDYLATGDKGASPTNPTHWCRCIVAPALGNDAGWKAGAMKADRAETPALALVIAALRARQQGESNG